MSDAGAPDYVKKLERTLAKQYADNKKLVADNDRLTNENLKLGESLRNYLRYEMVRVDRTADGVALPDGYEPMQQSHN